MQAIAFYIALPFLYLVSVLPYFLFYGFSDIIFFIIYYVFGYRKKVVYTNLRNAFPQKTEKEIRSLARKFYRYLVDLMLETFKTLTVSKKWMLRRCRVMPEAQELFARYHARGQSLIIVMGHYGNWEWAGNSFSLSCPQQLYVIYHPLANKHFNRLIVNMRTRFGTKLIAMRDTFKEMTRMRGEINATAFIADQTPAPENAYWTTFLNQDTPVFWGTEKIARKTNYPVVYVTVTRQKRGYYTIHAQTLFEQPAHTADGEISEAHTRKLERDILAQPEVWLWSHRRWKHKKPAEA